jgi:hypothetical protein
VRDAENPKIERHSNADNEGDIPIAWAARMWKRKNRRIF